MKRDMAFNELQQLLNHQQEVRIRNVKLAYDDKFEERITELRKFIDSQEDKTQEIPFNFKFNSHPVDPLSPPPSATDEIQF